LWVKDAADLERLVDEIMQKTNYPDSNLVRDTLLDYNFDMNATMDFILSMSLVVHQREDCQTDTREKGDDTPRIGDDEPRLQMSKEPLENESNNLSSRKVLHDMNEQCEDFEDSEDSGMPG